MSFLTAAMKVSETDAGRIAASDNEIGGSREHRSERSEQSTERDARATLKNLVCGDSVGGEPGLRIDGLVYVAVLDAGGVELEVQVGSERPAGLANAAN